MPRKSRDQILVNSTRIRYAAGTIPFRPGDDDRADILEKGFVHDALLNVNVPHLPRDRIAGVEVTRLGKRTYRDQLVERLDPYGEPYYWIGGPAIAGDADEGTDVAALRDGKISVTPIYLDLTNHNLIDELASWDWGWTAPVALSGD